MLKKVVIIGAGPAGLLLAHYLLSRGKYQIEIYESRRLQDITEITAYRTFPLSLQERGRKAIRMIPGLEEAIIANSIFCRGTLIYRKRGKPRNIKRNNPILTIDRNRLVAIFYQKLLDNYSSEQLKIHFGCEAIQIDSPAHIITLQPQTGDSFTVNYDILIGADGANSRVRNYLNAQRGLQCHQQYVPDSYKSLCLNRLNSELGIALESDLIHTSNMGNNTRILLVPQPDNQLKGVILFPADQNPFEDLLTSSQVLDFFEQNFPIFAPLLSKEQAEILLKSPVGRPITIRCDRFHDNHAILLIGDAAHAVSPSMGQGCNSSLQDVLILNHLLDQYDDNWQKVLPEFSKQRIFDAHAVQELSDYCFPRKGKLLIAEFFFRLVLGRLLNKYFPDFFKPFVVDLVFDTDIPYSQILSQNQRWINKVKQSSN
ncbi:Kynurenine 3-monooxygenase [Rippkaea orientalis PCC 8801]|uniref:Kynurenine 3-monooxygenase n=1 Tax=Rippkaea orientalis (strain PCC 8801 / RF-1) TaxID=41431 RepID=B7JYM4_RIPO1|nr:NAD(P)/FAD-dependent oxidoreductase [Rippkaea orientalis]ACK64894.1 Kynurenine 3-monooxygenase [Rippkaea orientalis PCC 8801]